MTEERRGGVLQAASTEPVSHRKEGRAGGNAPVSRWRDTEAEQPGLVCALCGKRFADKQSLAGHTLGPHFRSNRPPRQVSAYQSAF